MIIAYIGGNIGPTAVWFSTENAYADAFTGLGHSVVPIVQKEITDLSPLVALGYIEQRCGGKFPDLTVYTRTHNDSALKPPMTALWRHLEAEGVVTASVHLDIFWGLPDRHAWIQARDPLFTTGTVFTADGGSQDRWKQAGVNHVWLPAGADLRRLDPNIQPDPALAGQVVFVGSRGYHHRWPREKFVDKLEAAFVDRFRWYGNGSPNGTVRGKDLQTVYASDCVIVGDHCFAGERAYYWSDRTPETLGRHGLLMQPYTEGMDEWYTDEDLVYYDAGDVESLTDAVQMVGHWADEERMQLRDHGRATVVARDTYPSRAVTLLDTLGLQ